MKYRRLTNEELADLEKDFVRFLAANTVTADDWKKLSADDPERAEKLIELFSDIIFERTLEKVEYLEFKTPKDVKTFQFQEKKIVMNGLRIQGESDLDLTDNLEPEQMLKQLKSSGASLQMYSAEKIYRNGRTREMFGMMENGALISRDGALFNALEQLKNKK